MATKLPWPPVDGGRLVLWHSLQALAAQGHAIRLVVPGHAADVEVSTLDALRRICTPYFVPVRPRSWLRAALSSLLRWRALTTARHHHRAMQQAVAELVRAWRPQVVHAEQLQAWSHCQPARRAGIPVVLRMQNVESSLWQQVARARWAARPLLLEAMRLRGDERRAMRGVSAVVTLTERDAQVLRQIAGRRHADRITCIRPVFPAWLPTSAQAVDLPAVVVAGSAGWWPNTQGNRWLVSQVLPLLSDVPGLTVHVYAGESLPGTAVCWHPAPADATEAFPAGAIAAVPLLIGSGIRMRILEAWARGLAVVATPVAAAGLEVVDGEQLLIAASAADFAAALRRLLDDPDLRARLIAGGRAYLQQQHDRQRQTVALLDCYLQAGAAGR